MRIQIISSMGLKLQQTQMNAGCPHTSGHAVCLCDGPAAMPLNSHVQSLDAAWEELMNANMCICCPICISWLSALARSGTPLQSWWSGS